MSFVMTTYIIASRPPECWLLVPIAAPPRSVYGQPWAEIFAKPNCNPTLFFSNISSQGGPFFKPIFALKSWDWDGRFEYNKRFKWSFYKSEDFFREPQKFPQKPKIAGKPDLIGKHGFSCRHLWLLIEWNQVKYSRQLFFLPSSTQSSTSTSTWVEYSLNLI